MTYDRNFNQPKTKYYGSYDLDFTSSDSPVILDIRGSLKYYALDGEIFCKSDSNSGNILVEFSSDGVNYGNQIPIYNNEIFPLSGLMVDSIRITHSGTDSGYRVFAR